MTCSRDADTSGDGPLDDSLLAIAHLDPDLDSRRFTRQDYVDLLYPQLLVSSRIDNEKLIKFLDLAHDENIPCEVFESFCDLLAACLVGPDFLPWSRTGTPRCIIPVRRNR